MSAFTKFVVAALAAGAVHALPQATYSSSNSSSTTTSSASATSTISNADLIAELKTAGTAVDRDNLLFTDGKGNILPQDQLDARLIHDFNNSPPTGKGGSLSASNIDNFPILNGLGVSVTLGFLGPCGINTPHTHPRASEFLTLVNGSALNFGMIPENNFPVAGKNALELSGNLTQFQGTVFPLGSIHWQQNPTCDNVTFVAALSSEDPGTSQIAQNFFDLNAGIVNATLGFPESLNGQDIESFRNTIPPNLALGVDQCLSMCHLDKNGMSTN